MGTWKVQEADRFTLIVLEKDDFKPKCYILILTDMYDKFKLDKYLGDAKRLAKLAALEEHMVWQVSHM